MPRPSRIQSPRRYLAAPLHVPRPQPDRTLVVPWLCLLLPPPTPRTLTPFALCSAHSTQPFRLASNRPARRLSPTPRISTFPLQPVQSCSPRIELAGSVSASPINLSPRGQKSLPGHPCLSPTSTLQRPGSGRAPGMQVEVTLGPRVPATGQGGS